MLLEEVVEIIELTDSDHLSKAMELFNDQGIVHSEHFPFMNVVFDTAPQQLTSKLNGVGFQGDVQVVKCEHKPSYIVFDSKRYQQTEATQWAKNN